MGLKETHYDDDNFQGLFWPWKRKGLLYFSYQCLSKGRVFWPQQKKSFSNRKWNKVCQKAVPEGRCRLLEDAVVGPHEQNKLLRLSYCLTPKLMQAFHCAVLLPSCWLLFHDLFGDQHTALWSISRASWLRPCRHSCVVASRSHAVLPWSRWTHSCGLCWLKESRHHTAFLQPFCGLFWEICCDFQSCNVV